MVKRIFAHFAFGTEFPEPPRSGTEATGPSSLGTAPGKHIVPWLGANPPRPEGGPLSAGVLGAAGRMETPLHPSSTQRRVLLEGGSGPDRNRWEMGWHYPVIKSNIFSATERDHRKSMG